MVAIPNKLSELALVTPNGIRVIIDEYITKEIIRYKHLHPIINGHIWVQSNIERDSIVLIDSTILGGNQVALMNQVTWNAVKEKFYESN